MVTSSCGVRETPCRVCYVHGDIEGPLNLGLTLQEEEGLNQILKSVSVLQTLAKQGPTNWPAVKLVVRRVFDKGG